MAFRASPISISADAAASWTLPRVHEQFHERGDGDPGPRPAAESIGGGAQHFLKRVAEQLGGRGSDGFRRRQVRYRGNGLSANFRIAVLDQLQEGGHGHSSRRTGIAQDIRGVATYP